jgi:flagellar biosynthesis/type III secretory pathway protein FliH
MSLQTDRLEITGLPPETRKALDEKAQHSGKSAADYVRDLIEADLLASRSFDEILAPMRQGFKESGMSEEELDALFEEAREEGYQERQAKKKGANEKEALSLAEIDQILDELAAGRDGIRPLPSGFSREDIY